VVLIQEAKLPPSAVANLKRVAHNLLLHYCLFVGRLPKDGPSSQRHEVVTFVHGHLAARATLLDFTRQTMDVIAASRSELLSMAQVLRATDVQSHINILWLNLRISGIISDSPGGSVEPHPLRSNTLAA
jgi:hypothetical protein